MLFPSASFLLSALIARCVADPKNLNHDYHEYQVQGSAWPPLVPITGEQLSKTNLELALCIEKEKNANDIMKLQKELCDSRLAQLQQNESYASSNAKNLLEKWQTCESRINSSAPAGKIGAKKTSPKSTQKLLQLSTGQYYISNANQKANWYIASKICKSYGLELASVETNEENDALLGKIAMMKEDFHISGTDLGSEGKFYWASTGKPFGTFNDWTRNGVNPNNAGYGEHCVNYWYRAAYGETHTWNDAYCDRVNRFICEL